MYNEAIMKLLKGVGDYFALDIGTNAIRVVQLSGSNGSWTLQHYGQVPVDPKFSAADSPEARRKVGELIMTAVGQSGITTRSVVVGLPSQKTFTTVIDVPTMPDAELKSTLQYQVEQYIPTPIDDTKVDWAVLGQSLHNPKMQEVLLASTTVQFAEERLEMIEGLGLDVIGAEPDPIAMIRSLLPANAASLQSAQLIVDMGDQSTDIAVTYGDTPRIVRTIPVGLQTLIKAAVQNLNVEYEQAQQFILKFGLAPDRLEGQVVQALEQTIDNFAGDITKTVKFFQTRYPNTPIQGMLVGGYAAVIPHFTQYVAGKTGLQATIANPWQNVRVNQTAQQELAPIAHQFATAVGLAQRGGGA